MELGGNMPGDMETRFAIAEESKSEEPISIPAGELPEEGDYELAMPIGATREARQRARIATTSSERGNEDKN